LSKGKRHDFRVEDGTIRRDHHVDTQGDQATAAFENSRGEWTTRLVLDVLPGKRYDKAHAVLDIWKHLRGGGHKAIDPIGEPDADLIR
jgi:predicted DCC family thiol-disulfide oxidoreductase YuxK